MRTFPLLAATLMLAATIHAARAATPGFCRSYADTAAWQYRVMRKTPGCARPPGNLWHPDRDLHFSWCLTASPRQVKGQTRARDLAIGDCDPGYGD